MLECSFSGCPNLPEWNIFPPKRCPELAIPVCGMHRSTVKHAKQPREELYNVACRMVRESLVHV